MAPIQRSCIDVSLRRLVTSLPQGYWCVRGRKRSYLGNVIIMLPLFKGFITMMNLWFMQDIPYDLALLSSSLRSSSFGGSSHNTTRICLALRKLLMVYGCPSSSLNSAFFTQHAFSRMTIWLWPYLQSISALFLIKYLHYFKNAAA